MRRPKSSGEGVKDYLLSPFPTHMGRVRMGGGFHGVQNITLKGRKARLFLVVLYKNIFTGMDLRGLENTMVCVLCYWIILKSSA